MSGKIFFIPALVLLAGCATPSRSAPSGGPRSFPADALITQRGVLDMPGRQFPLNGYLATSATGAKRLIVTENFGRILADVLVKPDGTVRVMRSSRALRPAWIRDHMADDIRCFFSGAGRWPSPTHFHIERRRYKLDLQIVEVKPGRQPAGMFEEEGRP